MASNNDPLSGLSGQNLFGMPPPSYNPLGMPGGNDPMSMALAQFGPMFLSSLLGQGQFLPNQFQPQNMMDQMVTQKYSTASRANINAGRTIDQGAMRSLVFSMRSKFDATPPSATQAAGLNSTADMLNSEIAQSMMGMMFGPQVVEDLFFGRKGSAAMLAQSANKIGYYRPDAITGQQQMSPEGLETFTSQIYSNLYGAGADLNDVSGLSAGRVGILSEELAQRGLLPASLSQLSKADQRRALRDPANRPTDFTPEEVALIDGPTGGAGGAGGAIDKSVEEIAKLEGGAGAIRKIDATRVSNKLKEYAGAVGAIREIFGDNGMGSAPMGQLVAALDALTQGGAVSMKAGQLEHLIRRTQLAAREGGVSLEGLMSMSARGGMIADHLGLDRTMVAEGVVFGIQAAKSMSDGDAFVPGFGKMDKNAAALHGMERSLAASASPAGKYLAVAKRLVAENKDSDAFKAKSQSLISLVSALENGGSTMIDPTTGKSINIYEEMGKDSIGFFSKLFTDAGISTRVLDSYFADGLTQEHARGLSHKVALAQGYEITTSIGNSLSANVMQNGFAVLEGEGGSSLGREMSMALGEASVRDMGTHMTEDERNTTLKNAARSGIRIEAERRLRAANPGGTITDAEVTTKAEELFKGMFQGDGEDATAAEHKFQNFVRYQYSEASRISSGHGFGSLAQVQQVHGRAATAKLRETIHRQELRAAVEAANGGNFTPFMQRINDVMRLSGSADKSQIAAVMTGALSVSGHQEQLMDEAGRLLDVGGPGAPDHRGLGRGAFSAVGGRLHELGNDYSADTDAEKKVALDALDDDVDGKGWVDFKSRFSKGDIPTLFTNKEYVSQATIKDKLTKINTAGGDGRDQLLKLAKEHGIVKAGAETLDHDAVAKLAARTRASNALGTLAGVGDVAYTRADAEEALSGVLGLAPIADGVGTTDITTKRAKLDAMAKYTESLGTNTTTGADILGVFGEGLVAETNQADLATLIDKAASGKGADGVRNNTVAKDAFATLREALEKQPVGVKNQILAAVAFSSAQKALGIELNAPGGMSAEKRELISRVAAVNSLMEKDPKAGVALFGGEAAADAGQVALKDMFGKEGPAKTKATQQLTKLLGSKAERDAPLPVGVEALKPLEQVAQEKIDAEAAVLNEQAGTAATGAGIGSTILQVFESIKEQILPPISEALAAAFKDLKIEKVSIGTLDVDLGGTMSAIFAGLQSSLGGMTDNKAAPEDDKAAAAGKMKSGEPEEMRITGALTISNLQEVILSGTGRMAISHDTASVPAVRST